MPDHGDHWWGALRVHYLTPPPPAPNRAERREAERRQVNRTGLRIATAALANNRNLPRSGNRRR